MENRKNATFVITRRDFIKMTSAGAAAFALGNLTYISKAEAGAKKPAVLWMQGQDCAGCSESILATLNPDLRNVILDVICIRYHETLMAGSGYVAENALNQVIAEGGYVLVMEGAMPTTDNRYLKVAGRPSEERFVQAAGNAAAIVAIGACATFGGIPRSGAPVGQGVDHFMTKHNIAKPLVNLPGCPVHPAWFFDTVLHYLNNNGALPPLDAHKRPTVHFGGTVHRQCPRRRAFKNQQFLTDWNDDQQRDYCMLLKGCKGMWTYADCPTILWNDGANHCIGNNAPCSGCTEPVFYEGFSPLYKQTIAWKRGEI